MIIKPQKDYELIDSGDEMKLERYGRFVIARPDPQAIWPKKLAAEKWDAADASYIKTRAARGTLESADNSGEEKGKWHITNPDLKAFAKILADEKANGKSGEKNEKVEKENYAWPIDLGSIKLYARLTPFKHTGIFPEQLANWAWSEDIIKKDLGKKSDNENSQNQKPKILNLFGYTGGASIACAKAGAEVTHVDASRAAITWAKENMLLTGLDDQAIRWILEDAVEFVKKELRRGNKYDGIIMDPPVFGRGAKGEVWKIERDLTPLLDMCYELLSDQPLFFILNGYASGYSSVAYANNLAVLKERFGGEVENGELLVEETGGGNASNPQNAPRYLPCGIVARWGK